MSSTIATSEPTEPHSATRAGLATPLSVLPICLLGGLLLLATWFQGAFALRHWGPVAILALVVAAALLFTGASRLEGRAAYLAVALLFGLAGWSLLSALWAQAPGRALEGGARSLLYATLFFVAFAAPAGARSASRVGLALSAGIGLIGVVTLGGLLSDGRSEFLAGRLDDPVGYRNATACLFALAFWPFVAAAAHRASNPLIRSLAFSGALLALGFTFLTEARGVVLGLALGGAVALLVGPDRLRRAWVTVLAIGGIALISGRLLTPYRAFTNGHPESAADIGTAVKALTALVVLGFLVGLLGAVLDNGLRMGQRTRTTLHRGAAAALGVLAVLAAGVIIAATGNPISFAGDRLDEFRSLETAAPGETRLTFGGGQRSDLWRVALDELSQRPVGGVGEGNYSFRYYEQRRTDRNLSTPHSLVFELLSEKGVVGLGLFAGFLVALGLAAAGRWRGAPVETRWVASGLLAAAVVGIGQSTVDWIWLIPGVTGLAFMAAGLALAALGPRAGGRPPRRRSLPRLAAAVLASVAVVGVSLLYLSDVGVRRARVADASAEQRLSDARRAQALNPWAVAPRYLQAGTLEELGRREEARRELLDALEIEPNSFVTYALLGDLELRRNRRGAAARLYRRAAALNPLDEGLRKLVRRAEG